MNKIYKVIWSKVKHQYVVVSELAHSNGKQSSTSTISSVRGSLRAMLAALVVAGGVLTFTPHTVYAEAEIEEPEPVSTGMTEESTNDNITIVIDGPMVEKDDGLVFSEESMNAINMDYDGIYQDIIKGESINFSVTGGTDGENKQIKITTLGKIKGLIKDNRGYVILKNPQGEAIYADVENEIIYDKDNNIIKPGEGEWNYDKLDTFRPEVDIEYKSNFLDAGSDVIGNIASSEQVQKNKDGSLTLTKPGEKPGETIKQEFTNKGSLSSIAINGEYYEIPDYALQDGQVAVGETETIYDKDGQSNPVEVQTGATFLKVADRNDPTKSYDVKVDGLVTYNTREDNEGTVTTDYGNITLAGYVEKDENGNIKYDENGHPIRQGTRITNVRDGSIWAESMDAVNGSQLYAVDQKVNAGWTAKVGDTSINVRPNLENETGKDILNFEAGDNIKLTPNADENKIKIAADGVVSYDKNTSGGYNTTSVTLGGTKDYKPGLDDGETSASVV